MSRDLWTLKDIDVDDVLSEIVGDEEVSEDTLRLIYDTVERKFGTGWWEEVYDIISNVLDRD